MSLVSEQIRALLITVLAGLGVGLVFDMYRIFRNSIQPKNWMSILYDLIFWLVIIPLVFLMLLISNWGELRYYVFLGMGLGLFLYFQLISSWVLWSSVLILQVFRALFVGVGKLFVLLFLMPFRFFSRIPWGNPRKSFLAGRNRFGLFRYVPPLRWRNTRIFRM
jgi:spore cortex biosynthesis protein YabQ